MMNLDRYIKNEFIKNKFNDSNYIIVSDLSEAENVANRISFGERVNVIFETSFLKDNFFDLIRTCVPEVTIINCNSNIDIFENNVLNSYGPIIYNINKKININNNIIKIIDENKGILVC